MICTWLNCSEWRDDDGGDGYGNTVMDVGKLVETGMAVETEMGMVMEMVPHVRADILYNSRSNLSTIGDQQTMDAAVRHF